MKKNSSIIILLILLPLLGLVLGYLWGAKTGGKIGAPVSPEQIKKEVLQKLEQRGFLPPEPETITSISGRVTELGKDFLVIESEPLMWDLFGDIMPAKIKVKVGKDTKIEMLVEKSPEQLQKEEKAFEEKLQAYEERGEEMPAELVPPEPFERKEVSLSEIEKGGQVTAIARENIKGKESFQAQTIEFTKPAPPLEPES